MLDVQCSMFDVHFLINPSHETTPKWHSFLFDQTGRFLGQRLRSYWSLCLACRPSRQTEWIIQPPWRSAPLFLRQQFMAFSARMEAVAVIDVNIIKLDVQNIHIIGIGFNLRNQRSENRWIEDGGVDFHFSCNQACWSAYLQTQSSSE